MRYYRKHARKTEGLLDACIIKSPFAFPIVSRKEPSEDVLAATKNY
jgi:hypothetical protein